MPILARIALQRVIIRTNHILLTDSLTTTFVSISFSLALFAAWSYKVFLLEQLLVIGHRAKQLHGHTYWNIPSSAITLLFFVAVVTGVGLPYGFYWVNRYFWATPAGFKVCMHCLCPVTQT
jgi:hypothetical protein